MEENWNNIDINSRNSSNNINSSNTNNNNTARTATATVTIITTSTATSKTATIAITIKSTATATTAATVAPTTDATATTSFGLILNLSWPSLGVRYVSWVDFCNSFFPFCSVDKQHGVNLTAVVPNANTNCCAVEDRALSTFIYNYVGEGSFPFSLDISTTISNNIER